MKKVLIVDDDADLRDALAAMLSHEFIVLKASGKKEALEFLYSDEKPDIMLLDVRMESKQEGFELVEELSGNKQNIPIILVTSTEAMTVSNAVAEIARRTREKYAAQDLNILVMRSVTGEVMVDYKSEKSGESVSIKVAGYHSKPVNPEKLKREIHYILKGKI
ncbi:Regulator of RpoS [subsurface metagenome]